MVVIKSTKLKEKLSHQSVKYYRKTPVIPRKFVIAPAISMKYNAENSRSKTED